MNRRRRESRTLAKEWLVATQPGLGRLAATDLRAAGAVVNVVESDGRADLVVVEGDAPPPERATGLAEDVLVVIGRSRAGGDAREVARRLFDEPAWRAGVDVAARAGVRIGSTTGFRVIVRVQSERDFKRTELREAVTNAVLLWRPRWRVRDPADLEIWVLETRTRFRAAVRVSTAEMRSRGGRVVEHAGALRPTVAGAVVRAAGRPSGLLVDPFCGSGTVLAEARQAGWSVAGSDVSADAVEAARANVPGVEIVVADVTKLPHCDGAAGAVATNAPFGAQHVPATGGRELGDWWQVVLVEVRRIVRPGGAIAILHPDELPFREALRSTERLHEEGRTRLRTLGREAVIWTLRRN